MDDIDGLLSELGRSDPFPIDWLEYERDLLRRLANAEASRRRRTWGFTLAGMVAGVAATFMVMGLTDHRRTLTPAPDSPIARSNGPTVGAIFNSDRAQAWTLVSSGGKTGKSHLLTYAECQPGESRQGGVAMQPFVRKIGGGEIRFDGFSAPDAGAASVFAVSKQVRKLKVN